MRARTLFLERALPRFWALVLVIATLLGAGVVQVKVIEWDVPVQVVKRWWPWVAGAIAFLVLIYVAVFEVWLPLARKRRALQELRQHVSVSTLLSHYRNRPILVGNPVVLSRLHCSVEALPGGFPKDLKYIWVLEGTNT